jgi:lysozyme
MSELVDMIKRHEGSKKGATGRHILYQDTVAKWTCGYGRNASDVGFSEDEAELMLVNDLDRVTRELRQALPWFDRLDAVRQDALIDLGFNMGVLTPPDTAKLLTFTNTLKAFEEGRYKDAAEGFLHSKYAEQVGKGPPSETHPQGQRAWELAAMIATGKYQ